MPFPPAALRRALTRAALLAAAALPATLLTAAPAPASDVLFALTTASELVSVRSDVPGVPYARKRITGLPTGAQPMGLDSSPASGALVAAVLVGADLRLYTLHPSTAEAAPWGPGTSVGAGTTWMSIDFEPDGRTLRVFASGGRHFLLDAPTGTVTPQSKPKYAAEDAGAKTGPALVGLARTATAGLVALEAERHVLVRVGGPNGVPASGVLNTAGIINFSIERAAALAGSPGGDQLFAAVSDAGEQQSNLYSTLPGGFTTAYTGPFPDKDTVVGLAVGAGGLFDLDRPTYRVREADGSARFIVQRSGTMTAPAEVQFDLQDETATSGVDFPATAGVLAFAAGQESASVDVPITADSNPEGEEWAKVRLTETGGPAGFGFRRQARVAIVDGGSGGGQTGASTSRPASVRPVKPKPASVTPARKRLSLVVSPPRIRVIGRKFTIPFRCTTACRVVIDAKLDRKSARKIKRPATLGRGTRTLRKAGKGNVTIRVAKWSKRLRKVRRGTITFTVRGFGEKRTDQRKLTARVKVRR